MPRNSVAVRACVSHHAKAVFARPYAHTLFILSAAAILSLPALLVGIPAGYDAEYHTAYQYHFSRQFWEGDGYPRWLLGANKGYGSPIFLVQYPLPYFVTAFLRPVTAFPPTATREARELGLFCFLALAGAGLAARAWLRNHSRPSAATVSALVYMSLPYILGQALYLRAGVGELSALVWMPLALALVDRFQRFRPTVAAMSGFGVVFGLLLLSHVTSAVLSVPVLLGYAIMGTKPPDLSDGKRVASALLASLALGTCIAAVYVFPLVAYRHLFNLQQLQDIMPSWELGRWFAYLTSSGATRRFVVPAVAACMALALIVMVYVWRAGGSLLSRVSMTLTLILGSVLMIPDLGPAIIRTSGLRVSSFETPGEFSARILFTSLFTVALGFVSYCRIATVVTRREQWLLVCVCCAFMLMLPWSAGLWTTSHFAMIQFPFRLCGLLSLAVAGLFAVALDRPGNQPSDSKIPSAAVLGMVALAVVVGGNLIWRMADKYRNPQTAQLALARNVDITFRSYVSPQHIGGVAKRLGTTPDSYDVTLGAVDHRLYAECTTGGGDASVAAVRPREIVISANCSRGGGVRVTQLYFPLWRIAPGTSSSYVSDLSSSPEGLLQVAVNPGPTRFTLTFALGWPERVGMIVTLLAAVVALAGLAVDLGKRRLRRSSQNAASL